MRIRWARPSRTSTKEDGMDTSICQSTFVKIMQSMCKIMWYHEWNMHGSPFAIWFELTIIHARMCKYVCLAYWLWCMCLYCNVCVHTWVCECIHIQQVYVSRCEYMGCENVVQLNVHNFVCMCMLAFGKYMCETRCMLVCHMLTMWMS